MARAERLRLKVLVGESDPVIPSLVPVYQGANWFEREAFDMFGLRFEGHPHLRRILTHEAFVGHPLRKDYDPARRWILSEDQIYKPVLQTRLPETGGEDMFERMRINLGPSHPAMHGTFRLIADLDGETIVASDLEIGYLHRCFEKMAETHSYQQVIPYTDRLNYCSSFIQRGVLPHGRVELASKCPCGLGATILRVLASWTTGCNGDWSTPALTNGTPTVREEIYGLLEACSGARLTVAYGRIGGLANELPPDFMQRCRKLLEIIPPFILDIEKLKLKNRIWMERSVGVAAIPGEEAWNWGWTGPCLRPRGVPSDVRRAHPTTCTTPSTEVPVLTGGDAYDRLAIRQLETGVAEDHPPARSRHARGRLHRGRSARRPAEQGSLLQPDGIHDLPLQIDHGRHPGARRRALFDDRGRQRRARFLHRATAAPSPTG